MKRIFASLIVLFTWHLCIAQVTNFRQLTETEYYNDFDTLQKWITNVSPMYLVNDRLKGQNYLLEMKN